MFSKVCQLVDLHRKKQIVLLVLALVGVCLALVYAQVFLPLAQCNKCVSNLRTIVALKAIAKLKYNLEDNDLPSVNQLEALMPRDEHGLNS